MVSRRWVLLGALLLLLLGGAAAVWADGIDELERRIERFSSGALAAWSPEELGKARAYLGAAMLARDNHQSEQAERASRQAAEMLDQAERHARDFRARYAEMLEWWREARRYRRYDAIRRVGGPVSPAAMAAKAEAALTRTIAADERGALNDAAAAAREVVQWSRQSIAAALPVIRRMGADLLARARAANARYYAPTLYQAARRELDEVAAFLDGRSKELPPHPYHLLRLADDVRQLTLKVKGWRRKRDSHERLVLEGRAGRRRLARALGMEVAADDPVVDVRVDRLVRRAEQLRAQLDRAQDALEQQRKAMRQACARRLDAALAEQKAELEQSRQQQLRDLKAAFAAKLERETRESRRQAELRRILAGKPVKVLFNMDGSILLRLTGLHFPSGRSTLSDDQLPLLGAVVRALALYKERKVHIEGHTDNVGDVQANRLLSLKRAERVRDFLITSGVDARRLKALGYGEVRPIASNEFAKGRAMNRRIDIVILPE